MFLAAELLWKSQMSTQTTALSDLEVVAWTTKIFVWEEPKVELPNWYMIGDGLCSSGAQRIEVPECLKPRFPLDVQWFNCIEVVV